MTSIHVLSERASCSHGSWANNFALEDILAETCDALIFSPEQFFAHTRFEPVTGRIRRGRYRRLSEVPVEGADILLLVGMGPSSLRMLQALPKWRAKYTKVLAYIVDIYPPSDQTFDRHLAGKIDLLFVSYSQMVDRLRNLLEVETSFLPQAADVLKAGGYITDKRIDVAAFGRQPRDVLETLIETSKASKHSDLFAWWSEQKYPFTRNMLQDQSAFTTILNRSRISLCYRFEDTHPQSFKGVSPITARWFESAAAGCVIAGSRPSSPEGEDVLNWKDSVIDLSTDGKTCVDQLQKLLSDPQRICDIAFRNFQNAALSHDWGHRIVTLMESVSAAIPPALDDRLALLSRQALDDHMTY